MPSFESIYIKTEANINKAVEHFKILRDENIALREQNERISAELEQTKQELDKTKEKLKLVELTKTIKTKKDSQDLKRQINEWVRETDESIRILESM